MNEMVINIASEIIAITVIGVFLYLYTRKIYKRKILEEKEDKK
jgi:hypothetical protein